MGQPNTKYGYGFLFDAMVKFAKAEAEVLEAEDRVRARAEEEGRARVPEGYTDRAMEVFNERTRPRTAEECERILRAWDEC